MAKFKNGIMGPVVGAIGTVVGSSRNGVHYLRARTKRRRRKKDSGEKHNQDKLALAHYYLQPMLDYLREGFKGAQSGAYNAAKSIALRHALSEEAGKWVIDPSKVKTSQGTLSLPEDISVTRENNILKFKWGKSPANASEYDQVMLIAHNIDEIPEGKKLGQFRSNRQDILELPKGTKEKYHIYVSFIADDRSRQSDSVYLGLI